MRLSNDKVKIIPYEPQLHAPLLYRWYHSGKYGMLFDNLPLFSIHDCMALKECYAIVNPATPTEVFGIALLHNKDERNRRCEVHTMIAEEHQKKGVVQEAGKFLIYHIMNCMNFYKVIAIIREENLAAEKAAKSFGWELEGVLKHHIYIDGEFHNMKQYYMTKGMFNKRYKQAIEAEVRGHETGETP